MSTARFTPDDYFPAGRDALALAFPPSPSRPRDQGAVLIGAKDSTMNYSASFREAAVSLRQRAQEPDVGDVLDKCLSLAAYFERKAEEAELKPEDITDRPRHRAG
jgi:hypothetical protein